MRELPQRLDLIFSGEEPLRNSEETEWQFFWFWLLRIFESILVLRLDVQDDQDRAKIALMGYKASAKFNGHLASFTSNLSTSFNHSRTRPWTNVEVPLAFADFCRRNNCCEDSRNLESGQ